MNLLFKKKSKNNNITNILKKSTSSKDNLKENLDRLDNTCCKFNIQIEYDIDIKDVFLQSELSKLYVIHEIIYEKYNKAAYIVVRNNKKYVLKIRHNTLGNTYEKTISNILSQNVHPNIIHFTNFYQNDDYYFLIYEYVEGINLYQFINSKDTLDENLIRNIIIQLTNALQFLHSYNIIHCDLKLDNIVITHDLNIKVIDFDLSIICNNSEGYISNSIFGTMQYIAPESYDLSIYSKKTDIWQLGIVLYILITKKFPHEHEITLVNSFSNLCRQNIFKHIDLNIVKTFIFKNKYSDDLFYLVENLLMFDESKRYSINDILNFPWINHNTYYKKIDN
ncbi:serine/threonine-protein kinase [Fadolivirus algeromassiliense]|jgi:serine/threonine protein kinase|uniref:Serine/threonine-protein kinase n=1 Tax=Fadolivirus FV1/VV64 TaxID=3070911 RepID=A0A7D3QWK6_9VIRU|nr:serine/threonine-protein kinase [Fadolivirus algeromassiliense]QKF93680.1 serine/threonine-protein kinase [Fadolivirus FV1/VV64]